MGHWGWWVLGCAKAGHLLLAGEQSLPAGIKVGAEAIGKALYCQQPAEIGWGFGRLEKEYF